MLFELLSGFSVFTLGGKTLILLKLLNRSNNELLNRRRGSWRRRWLSLPGRWLFGWLLSFFGRWNLCRVPHKIAERFFKTLSVSHALLNREHDEAQLRHGTAMCLKVNRLHIK